MNRNKRAFTLIELLVVVVIIAILAAIALPQYQKAVEKTRATGAIATMHTLTKAIDVYKLNHRHVPITSFLGQGDNMEHVGLDIDLEKNLTCTTDPAGPAPVGCYNQNFFYDASCEARECWVDAVRLKSNIADPLHFSDEDVHYSLIAYRNDNEDKTWRFECMPGRPEWEDPKSVGLSMCQYLESQGWLFER